MKRLLLTLAGAAGLMAIAPLAAAEDEDANAEDQRLGPEVNRICFGRNINGWKTVDKEDDVILLERGVNNWYRVELIGACDYHVLRRALTIAIDSHPASGCVTRGDFIIVEDSPSFSRRCSIRRMYEWDDDAPAPGEEEEAEEDEESSD